MTNNFIINADFSEYKRVFLDENSKLNLISKKDEEFLYEKHIYDSLAIKLFFEKYNIKQAKILDIGCGGGFPCVPIAVEYPQFKIVGLDSIEKKINAVKRIKDALKLENLELVRERAENLKKQAFDVVTSRAVASLAKICEYALPLVKSGGYFVAYKSQKTEEEIKEAKDVLQKYNAKIVDIIEYSLPTTEIYKRNLIIISC